MKRNGIVLSIGALVSALFLSGCMAAMLPAMLLGHAAHNKKDASHEQPTKPCECEKQTVAAADVQAAPVGPADEKPSPPPNSGHKY